MVCSSVAITVRHAALCREFFHRYPFGFYLACAQKKKGHRVLHDHAVSLYSCLGWGYGFVDSLGGYALLLHRVALPQGYRAIF